MTTTGRQRFSVRTGLVEDDPDEGSYDGVPQHLVTPLQTWVHSALRVNTSYEEDTLADAVALRLRLTVPNRQRTAQYLCSVNNEILLDSIDEILAIWSAIRPDASRPIEDLEFILDQGGSAYRVNEQQSALENRVLPAVRDAMNETISQAVANQSVGSAAEHLNSAWKAAYGRHPESVRAYSEAIKAVESAAHSTIQPNHAKATLGTMLGEIGNARSKFSIAITTPAGKDPIAPIEAMMRTLWYGQTSRHGNKTATVPETLDSARAAVHVASTLVQLFSSGAVVRNP
ncbi:hypothetical protein [Streptomyces sp. DSM 40484]|uniref:hypothetical protein n=1 Tax=Streptomyces kroppenstedtii TaxID=3051181 RepID=UPI0028D30B94|nr:hypothetical protein [Streptomyces sp. DSM 40484]